MTDTKRPEQLGATSEEIREMTRIRDTADTWKVYRQEWSIVFTSQGEGSVGQVECMNHFHVKFAGRLEEGDFRVVSMFDQPPTSKQHLELNLWNQRGEFKHRKQAELYNDVAFDGAATIVSRNSREEQQLRNYSVSLLPGAAPRSRRANA